MGDLSHWLTIERINVYAPRTKCTDERRVMRVHKHTRNLHYTWGALAVALYSLIASILSQTGWLAPSPWSVGGPMVMNVSCFFVKSPVLLQHARQNEKQIKEAGNWHREDVWLLAIELSALFTPNETTFSTAAY